MYRTSRRAILKAVSARPWDGTKSVKEAVRVVLPDVRSLAVMAETEALGKARRLHMIKTDIMKHWVDKKMSRMPLLRRREATARTLRKMTCTARSRDRQVGRSETPLDNSKPETSGKRNAEEAGHEQGDAERLTQACTRPSGMQVRSVLVLWLWLKRTGQQGSSDELVLLV